MTFHPRLVSEKAMEAAGKVAADEKEDDDDDEQTCGGSLSSSLASSWFVFIGKLEQMSGKQITAVLIVTLLSLMIIPLCCVCGLLTCARFVYHIRETVADVSNYYSYPKAGEKKQNESRPSDNGQGGDDFGYEQYKTDPYLDVSEGYETLNNIDEGDFPDANSTMREDDPMLSNRSQFNAKRVSLYNKNQVPKPEYLPGYEVPVSNYGQHNSREQGKDKVQDRLGYVTRDKDKTNKTQHEPLANNVTKDKKPHS